MDSFDKVFLDVYPLWSSKDVLDSILLGDNGFTVHDLQYARHVYHQEQVTQIYNLHKEQWPLVIPSAILVPVIILGIFACTHFFLVVFK